jgi:hypothetical protein
MRLLLPFVFLAFVPGCFEEDKPATTPAKTPEKPAEPPKPAMGKRTPMNKNKTLLLESFDDGKKRVVIEAAVCLREGALELLMCRKPSKEHESLLHSDVNAIDIHTVLILAKAKPGSPVTWQPDYKPAHGTKIKIWLEYVDKKGATVTVPAATWVRNFRTQKQLESDWVFAGSRFFKDPDDPKKEPFYMANNGDVISVANFPDSMLDLPIESSKENASLAFEAWTERIPELKTKVNIILEPVLEK